MQINFDFFGLIKIYFPLVISVNCCTEEQLLRIRIYKNRNSIFVTVRSLWYYKNHFAIWACTMGTTNEQALVRHSSSQ